MGGMAEEGGGRLIGDRFHAWQSALLFSAIFVVHLLFSWSSFMSWLLFLGDLGLIGYLTMRAYKDGMIPIPIPDPHVFHTCWRWIGGVLGTMIADRRFQRILLIAAKCRFSVRWRVGFWMMSRRCGGRGCNGGGRDGAMVR